MRGGCNDAAVEADRALHLRRQLTKNRSGQNDLAEHVLREAEPLDQFMIPLPRIRIQKLARAGLGVLVRLAAAEPPVQIVRRHEEGFCRFQLFRMLQFQRHKLVDRVIGRLLDACSVVKRLRRNDLRHLRIHAVCPAVAVADEITDRAVAFVQQNKIHAPCVDADAVGNLSQLLAAAHSFKNVRKDRVIVPAEMTVFLGHAVGKAVNFLHVPALRPEQNVPAGGRADVNGKAAHL